MRLLCLLGMAALLCAADVTGSWKGDLNLPDGQKIPVTFSLKQEGGKLSGSVVYPNGRKQELIDGAVNGNQVAFGMVNGERQAFTCEGRIDGDEIALTISGGPSDDHITIRRQQ